MNFIHFVIHIIKDSHVKPNRATTISEPFRVWLSTSSTRCSRYIVFRLWTRTCTSKFGGGPVVVAGEWLYCGAKIHRCSRAVLLVVVPSPPLPPPRVTLLPSPTNHYVGSLYSSASTTNSSFACPYQTSGSITKAVSLFNPHQSDCLLLRGPPLSSSSSSFASFLSFILFRFLALRCFPSSSSSSSSSFPFFTSFSTSFFSFAFLLPTFFLYFLFTLFLIFLFFLFFFFIFVSYSYFVIISTWSLFVTFVL